MLGLGIGVHTEALTSPQGRNSHSGACVVMTRSNMAESVIHAHCTLRTHFFMRLMPRTDLPRLRTVSTFLTRCEGFFKTEVAVSVNTFSPVTGELDSVDVQY